MKTKKTRFLSFDMALKFARNLKFKSSEEWLEYSKTDNKPSNIPSNPYQVYRNNGWISWGNWLGNKNIQGTLRKYGVNDNYFKKWSHDMAYILGFWWADGCIMKRNNTYIFNISQSKKDDYLIKNILRKMKSNYPMREKKIGKKYYINININSKTIFDDIKRMGGMKRKSLVIDFPDVPNKYLSDFIRGYWDGDGCIYFSKNRGCYRSSCVSGSVNSL